MFIFIKYIKKQINLTDLQKELLIKNMCKVFLRLKHLQKCFKANFNKQQQLRL